MPYFCWKCGSEIKRRREKFCPQCGIASPVNGKETITKIQERLRKVGPKHFVKSRFYRAMRFTSFGATFYSLIFLVVCVLMFVLMGKWDRWTVFILISALISTYISFIIEYDEKIADRKRRRLLKQEKALQSIHPSYQEKDVLLRASEPTQQNILLRPVNETSPSNPNELLRSSNTPEQT